MRGECAEILLYGVGIVSASVFMWGLGCEKSIGSLRTAFLCGEKSVCGQRLKARIGHIYVIRRRIGHIYPIRGGVSGCEGKAQNKVP